MEDVCAFPERRRTKNEDHYLKFIIHETYDRFDIGLCVEKFETEQKKAVLN